MTATANEERISTVFDEFALLAMADGVVPISNRDGCWIRKVDRNWTIAVNGHNVTQVAHPEGCMDIELKPFNAAVWWNGWLAGLLTPFDGCVAAHPSGANEDALLAALRKARASTESKGTQ